MKNFFKICLTFVMCLIVVGCSQEDIRPNQNDNSNNTDDNQSTQTVQANKILIAYFTLPETDGTDTSSSASRVVDDEVLGATEYIASIIQDNTDGDLFEIKTVQNYPTTHEALVDQADEELSKNARPELATHINNLDQYDTIFIGYPNWWGDMPMPLYTFFEEYDFSNKTIIPFNTHGGSGFSSTIQSIKELQPNANIIEDGITISRNNVPDSREDVETWLKDLGLIGNN
ncbi:flavodoxin [Erysipelatoclostridium ramosum]|uniref:flavodoxin n=1 Tax=Thomasclavelia ramosa TaxID=1547 RepID=UPI00192A835C|nr:flavodoxin [Thomasclavelia ramosa]MCR1946429.1 flavodoxin [Thomasclavelia ramosa]QQY26336.1 flavodoxin [Thomasclavelia ramosa]